MCYIVLLKLVQQCLWNVVVWEHTFFLFILLLSVLYYNQIAMLNASVWCCTGQWWWIDQLNLFLDLQQGQINIFLTTPGLPKATTCWLLTVISKSANQQTTSGLESRSPFTLSHSNSDHKTANCLWLIHIKNADDGLYMLGKGQLFIL